MEGWIILISLSNCIYPPILVKTAWKIGNNGFNGQNVNLSYGKVDNLDQLVEVYLTTKCGQNRFENRK